MAKLVNATDSHSVGISLVGSNPTASTAAPLTADEQSFMLQIRMRVAWPVRCAREPEIKISGSRRFQQASTCRVSVLPPYRPTAVPPGVWVTVPG